MSKVEIHAPRHNVTGEIDDCTRVWKRLEKIGQARLAMSQDMKALMQRHEKNLALSNVATDEAETPWDALGLSNPNSDQN